LTNGKDQFVFKKLRGQQFYAEQTQWNIERKPPTTTAKLLAHNDANDDDEDHQREIMNRRSSFL